jgi:RimK-like ATPgrasp N-terminal domain
MLVVSNIDLTNNLPVMKPEKFLSSTLRDFTLNLNNDYRYMKTGYYVSLHAEILGNRVIPSSENIIDSSRTPILLLRAARAGIPTLPFIVTDSVKKITCELGFPVVVYAVNPFIHHGYKTANNKTALYRVVKSLGMNYKFAVCAQPLKGEMRTFKSFFGKCDDKSAQEIAKKVYALFQIPICQLHVQKIDGKTFLSGLQPIEKNEIVQTDLKAISNEALLLSEQGDHISG